MSMQFTLSPNDLRKALVECMKVGLVPYIEGSPGIGKSQIVSQVADDFSLELIDLRMSQCAPEDLMGLPMRQGDKAIFAPFDMFPLTTTKLPKSKKGWLLFLDELPSASKAVIAAAYKIILDRMVGGHHLHPNVVIVTAGNKVTDRAIATSMGTAMQSRLIHLELEVTNKDFSAHARKTGMDHRILGFLEFQPSRLHKFDPNHNDKTFACPRTWEFVSKLISGKPYEEISLPLLSGAISQGVAVEFHTFLQEYEHVPKFSVIVSNPEKTEIPPEGSTKYAVISMIVDYISADNIEDVITYVKRMPPEFQMIFFRGVVQKDISLKSHPAFQSNILHLTRFLHDDDDLTINQQAA